MSIKPSFGALLFLLALQPAKSQTVRSDTDSIRYFLVNALEVPARTAPYTTPGMCGLRENVFSLELYSAKASIYSQARYKVMSVFEIEDLKAVILESMDNDIIIAISNLQKTAVQKGDIINKITSIGEAAWHEDEKRYEIEIVPLRKDRKKATRSTLEEYLDKLS